MKVSGVKAVYYSATGNTRTVITEIAQHVAKRLEVPLESFDFSRLRDRKTMQYAPDQLVIFGMPVYAGRIPNKMLPVVRELFEGKEALAVPVVTFGNRNYDDALLELRNELEQQGFHTIAGAAFAVSHAFSDQIAPGRPDAEDMAVIHAFANGVADKILAMEVIPPPIKIAGIELIDKYYTPLGMDGKPAVFLKAKPKTKSNCKHCNVCINVCPMGAIDSDDPSLVKGTCIKCHACVRKCPEQAKYFDDPAFLSHVKMLEDNYHDRAEADLFL